MVAAVEEIDWGRRGGGVTKRGVDKVTNVHDSAHIHGIERIRKESNAVMIPDKGNINVARIQQLSDECAPVSLGPVCIQ